MLSLTKYAEPVFVPCIFMAMALIWLFHSSLRGSRTARKVVSFLLVLGVLKMIVTVIMVFHEVVGAYPVALRILIGDMIAILLGAHLGLKLEHHQKLFRSQSLDCLVE